MVACLSIWLCCLWKTRKLKEITKEKIFSKLIFNAKNGLKQFFSTCCNNFSFVFSCPARQKRSVASPSRPINFKSQQIIISIFQFIAINQFQANRHQQETNCSRRTKRRFEVGVERQILQVNIIIFTFFFSFYIHCFYFHIHRDSLSFSISICLML